MANQGVPMKSALAGRVVGAAEGDGPYGWYVMVEHGGAFSTVYAHLSKIRVKVGDVVDKSQIVGEVGKPPGNRPARICTSSFARATSRSIRSRICPKIVS